MSSEPHSHTSGVGAAALLDEAKKLRRVPGIVFAPGPVGRRARIAGTGIDVFEVMKTYRAVGEDRVLLREVYDWLSVEQVAAALAYVAAYPEEIEERLALEAALEEQYGQPHAREA